MRAARFGFYGLIFVNWHVEIIMNANCICQEAKKVIPLNSVHPVPLKAGPDGHQGKSTAALTISGAVCKVQKANLTGYYQLNAPYLRIRTGNQGGI